jgi:hypothetical protein
MQSCLVHMIRPIERNCCYRKTRPYTVYFQSSSFSFFRLPAYGPWATFELVVAAPRHLCGVFLLVLSLFTCLPLPTFLSFFFGLLVSGIHIFGLAVYGRQTFSAELVGENRSEDTEESFGDHCKKVSTQCIFSSILG